MKKTTLYLLLVLALLLIPTFSPSYALAAVPAGATYENVTIRQGRATGSFPNDPGVIDAALTLANGTAAGTATASAPSSTWIAYTVPFTGDHDRDGWTVVELGLAPGGPFDLGTRKIPGPPEWRGDSFRGLTPDTDYYLQVTVVDPDGVSGTNPQIVGPVHTLASAPNAVTLGTSVAEARDTEIFVSLPISDDANSNSSGTVEIATDAGGPWTEKCSLTYHPKRCRLRGLTPGTDYWVRVDIVDPDGISGTDPQILGPITYYGRTNLAAGRLIIADPGWGCCPNPAALVDGRIQAQNWMNGFAWTGGVSGYGGGPAGWKQATIDLGAPTTFDRVEVWLHDNNSPPTDWRVETSDDGASWTEAWSTTDPQCRGASESLLIHWSYPSCSQGASFAPVTARYVRYWFDDRTLFGGLHGWASELEVFEPAADLNSTLAGAATGTAPSSTWIAYEAPFTGDDDRDGWTVVELGVAPGGPFDLGTRKIPGPPEWRADTYRGLTPDTDYYLRVTFVDPDGVSGTNPQIVGPVHTLASAPDAVTLATATAEARDTEILVSSPIADDANGNSYGTVEIATDPGGPWTERCGDPSQNRLPFHPKRCRLRSLTPGTDYWVRIDITDPDGISGTDPQVLGPITYYGRTNLAAGRPITADPGWGCCPNPAQLVDGRIQYRFWPYGFAWTGGNNGYAGGPAGWKQATVDLGAPTTFDRVEVWLHDGNSPPTDWRVETSDDGAGWSEAWSTTDPQCRGASEQLEGTSWGYPACSQGALFAPVTARYVRYWFDDRTLFGGLHGWAVELEVFAPAPPGALIIEKQTEPDGAPGSFSFSGDAAGTIGDGGQILVSDLPPGTYTSQETVPAGWDLTDITCDDGNSSGDVNTATATFQLEAGETVKCTFTNTQPGTIIVEKQTEPDGAPGSFSFSGDAAGTIGDGGQIVVTDLSPGTYTSQETVPAGWDLTNITCDDGNSSGDVNTATATFQLEAGETVKCTFTNTQPGTIIVEKQTEPDGAPGSFSFGGDAAGTIGDGGQIVVSDLPPGTYTSQETVPAGWDLTNITCDDGNSSGDVNTATATFQLEAGETVKCTFTNTQPGTIIVEKQTFPDGAPDSFEFSPSYGSNYTLVDGGTNDSGPLTPGSYAVGEINIPAGWGLTSATCDDGSDPSSIGLDPGETVICTFINTNIPIYVSSSTNGTAGGVLFEDEDILRYESGSGTWSMVFDGSDVGVEPTDVDGFLLLSDGNILMSFDEEIDLPGAGLVDDSDIVQFSPTSLDENTAGSFSLFFDGSDVGLSSDGEDIDAIGVSPDGRLVFSTRGSFYARGVSGMNEDLLLFTAANFGSNTVGVFELYFDGSDVDLAANDVESTWVDPATGEIYLSVDVAFALPGVSGDRSDVFICDPVTTGPSTSCTYGPFWDGSANGYGGELTDGVSVGSSAQPVTVSDGLIYVSSSTGGNAGGVWFADEDILAYDTTTGTWMMVFDGSDVGLNGSNTMDVDGFHVRTDGSILLSVVGPSTLPDVGSVDDSDIVLFVPTSLGPTTAGTFSLHFDGSDVWLSTDGEDVDGIYEMADGDLVLSTVGGYSVSGAAGTDEDLIRFTPTSLGATTSGTWVIYFDGSDVGLNDTSAEDVWGTWIDETTGQVYLTTFGPFSVSGVSGDGADIFICNPGTTGPDTSCTFSPFWDGSADGFDRERVDGMFIGP